LSETEILKLLQKCGSQPKTMQPKGSMSCGVKRGQMFASTAQTEKDETRRHIGADCYGYIGTACLVLGCLI
jgi:hypothetical protein